MTKVFCIAEVGINHNGSKDILKQLIDGAISYGANAIKMQKRTVEKVYTKIYLDSYRESPWGTTQREQKMGLELTEADYDWIDEYCRDRILWSASCWDEDSVKFLRKYDLAFNKVASAMINKDSYLNMVAEEGKHTYISTGMVETWDEIDNVVEIFEKHRCPFSLLHTVSTYPMNLWDANLLMIPELKKRYNCEVGWSDHSQGRLLSTTAVGLGATCLENHITTSKCLYGSDQAASLELSDYQKLILDVRGLEKAMGTGKRELTPGELATKKKLRP